MTNVFPVIRKLHYATRSKRQFIMLVNWIIVIFYGLTNFHRLPYLIFSQGIRRSMKKPSLHLGRPSRMMMALMQA